VTGTCRSWSSWRPGVEGDPDKQQAIADSILTHLLRLNSEFANYVPPDRRALQVTLAPTGDPDHFPVGVKHRYTRPSGTSSALAQ
jgi:phenylacetate-CoA ligase